jgi:hypothetical protein
MPRLSFVALVLAAFQVAVTGCGKKEEVQVPQQTTPQVQQEKRGARVVVPDEVQGKWKAVKIAVFDKEKNQEDVYTVDIGSEFAVGGSNITVKVINFLPAFIMDGITMTSVSNEVKNPGAQIVISEEGKEAFNGWLFSLYPGIHAFQHSRYSFTLVDFIPAS